MAAWGLIWSCFAPTRYAPFGRNMISMKRLAWRKLLCRAKPLNREEQDYVEILTHEIERYEAIAYPMPAVSPAAMLRHLLEARSVALSEVAQATTISLSTLSSVLNGKRELNLIHIRKLAPYFGVEPGVFLD